MLTHPNFDPVALHLGPLAIRWYGLMYLVGFALFFVLGRHRLTLPLYRSQSGLDARMLEDVLFHGAVGVVLGGRLGYILFYKPGHYLQHPLEILMVWQGGMSFHGGLLGVLIACAWYARLHGLTFLQLMDFVAPLVPPGLAAVRVGNFINGELWGRPSTLSWAMIFPQAGDGVPRHPSQLYQVCGEGLLLFALLWWYSSRLRPRGAVSGLFLLGYAVTRFLAEYAREPDAFLGFLVAGLTMGQMLCLPMAVGGLWLLRRADRSALG
jgi:phosphatidylglycerol:prolipoprotein diacylglycerol transferase